MKLESQVVSRELAQKLKELGVKQESYFYWEDEEHIAHYVTDQFDYERMVKKHPKLVSAFTVAELGEMLPFEIKMDKRGTQNETMWAQLSCFKDRKSWHIQYMCGVDNILCEVDADTEADARSKMLCYLLENKLITL